MDIDADREIDPVKNAFLNDAIIGDEPWGVRKPIQPCRPYPAPPTFNQKSQTQETEALKVLQ